MASTQITAFLTLLCLCVAGIFLYQSHQETIRSWNGITEYSGKVGRLIPVDESPPQTKTETQCSSAAAKVKQFVMVKIGKTGTTTMRSIFVRYASRNRLSCLNPAVGRFVNWRKQKGWSIEPENAETADTLLHHAVYNPTMLDRLMTPGYKLVVPTRHPVSWFKSAVTYYSKQFAHIPTNVRRSNVIKIPNKVIDNETLFYVPRKDGSGLVKWFHIPQLQWLGYKYTHKPDIQSIRSFISWILPRIDMIMLNDQFDASLLILRRRFCWDYVDIFYQSGKVSDAAKTSELTDSQTEKIMSLNYGDLLLYEELNSTWWAQQEVKDQGFWEEVHHFRTLNSQMPILCSNVKRTHHPTNLPASRWHPIITLTEDFCKNFRCGPDCRKLIYANKKSGLSPP